MHEEIIQLSDSTDTAAFYGANNTNLQVFKNLHPNLNIIARGYYIKATGQQQHILQLKENIQKTEQFLLQNGNITPTQIIQIIHNQQPTTQLPQNLILHGINGKPITARTKQQQQLLNDYQHNDLLFAIGPAGTGKTYTAIALAVKSLKNREVKKIILSRPAVEAGEKLGFLPGDMKDKIDPYLQPLYDALEDMIPQQKLQEYLDKNIIQIAPLAFMRGRTLSNAVIILDEAQNTTIPQIKMFLTRLGMQSKMIITGDLTQIDLPNTQTSGLKNAIQTLQNTNGISIIQFNQNDILRHPLVQRIINAYQQQHTTT